MKATRAQPASVRADDSPVPLESVLCTEELNLRPRRPPNFETENRALTALAQALADSPQTILQTLADTILQVFQADSAGLSLVTDDGKRFYWPAIAGAWKPHVGGGTPRDFGPCGDVLDRNAPLLFKHFERRYAYLLPATPAADEALLVPFHVDGKAVGTIWAMAHGDRRRFDAEDLRQLESVGRFASAAYQAVQSPSVDESRRAALNLMEDALQSRQAMETLNMQLRESEERLRQAQQAAHVGSFELDLRTGINTWSPELEELYGLPRGSFAKTQPAWEDLVHPDDRAEALRCVDQALASAEPTEGEWRVVWPDGTIHWLAARWRVYTDDSGKPLRMSGINIDITERKRAEAATTLLAAIVQSSDDAIVTKNLDGVITSWNAGAERIFGYTAAEAIGQPITLLIPDECLDEEPRILERIKRGERVEHFQTVRRRKDGAKLDVSLTISPVRDGKDRIIGASKIARDITQSVRLERDTRQQAQALADLHRRKDEFLAMLGHELRNPLAPISNAVQLLRLQKSEDPVQQQARVIIERQLGQLTRLVDDLLEVSRVTTGRIYLRLERLALNGVVEGAVDSVRPLIGRRGHSLEVSMPPQPVCVSGDAARLEQVFVNLLTNAAKYTDEGGHIWLALKQEGDEAVLRVRDTGVGIAPDLLPRVFELFTQAERSLDRSQGGLGIGLSLVQRLVEMQGGRVEAYSSPGQGSEFVVRLPVAASAAALPSPSAQAPQPVKANGARVLIVDDNVDVAESTALLLQASGHDVRTAHDGPGALQTALDQTPDVVLLDIGLPGMNGFEVAKRLREQPALHNVVLVAMTGYGLESDRKHSQEAGFDHHLVKPADFAQVQKILASVAVRAA